MKQLTIDVGGTFTDCLVLEESGELQRFKAATTPEDPTVGFFAAVGKAVEAYYKNVKVYDKYHPRDSIEEAAAADYIFVAVPTPYDNGPDLTEMNDAIANIAVRLKTPEKQVIIIKSTVLPGTTDDYQAKYPDANFIFNPEFLTESAKEEDFAKPDKQLVGYTEKTKNLFLLR